MTTDDDSLGKMLHQHGLLTREEYDAAMDFRKKSGRPLPEILVELSFLTSVQVEDALAAIEKRVRFCGTCRQPVHVPRSTAEGERCPRCMGALTWKQEGGSAQVESQDKIIQLTRDELPGEVESARMIPSRVFGKYILLQEVGRGGAGVVQKAWDTMLGDYVALKFIRQPRLAAGDPGPDARQRQTQILDLLQEARAALRLRHPNIVPIRDVGEIDRQFYISMDYIAGDTLADRMRAAQARGRLSALYEDPAYYLSVMRDIANAIHYAHTFPKPIVHCDLKPSNLLISVSRVPYVMDFGLARMLNEPRGNEFIVRGTPAYMAPEQLTGRPEDLGPWTDIYGLGGILYELLAGQPVFSGDTPAVLSRARRDTPTRPTDVIRETKEAKRGDSTRILANATKIEGICLRCLSKQPKDRYASAREVAEELESVIASLAAAGEKHETKSVPVALREAQEDAELRRVDQHLTNMDLEGALKEADQLEKRRNYSRVRHWIEDRRRQVEILEAFRTRLTHKINERRPMLARLQLVTGALKDVEFLKATTKKVVVYSEGRSLDLEWSAITLAQVVGLAEAMEMSLPEDKLALGVICHHAGLVDLAEGFLRALTGTELEPVAQHVLRMKKL